jgi:hypothetical protein
MKSLKNHIVENANTARGAKRKLLRDRTGDAGDVRVMHSLGLDGATVSLPAGIDLESRAERMNKFWKELVRLQYDDVVVVAVSASGE